jgi:hypothetical protein
MNSQPNLKLWNEQPHLIIARRLEIVAEKAAGEKKRSEVQLRIKM